jgi:hypothetical protein
VLAVLNCDGILVSPGTGSLLHSLIFLSLAQELAPTVSVMIARSVRDWRGGIDGQECRPGASAHGRARGGFFPSNS